MRRSERHKPSILLLLAVMACGDDSSTTADTTSTSTAASTSITTDATTTAAPDTSASSTSSSSGSATTTADATTDPNPTTTDGSTTDANTTGTTGLSLDETYTELSCVDGSARAGIWILPGRLDGMCPPPPKGTMDMVIIALDAWDGMAGEFDVVPDGSGSARATLGLAPEPATGTVSVQVSAPWALSHVAYDLTSATLTATDSAEVGLCQPADAHDPCM